VLVTAFDILFFWVARMIMMGLRFMGEEPFRDVHIHALVRDAEGQKMSKSKGNVVDPLLLIDRYGADAFRFTLAAFAAQGRDIKFAEERVEGNRHFINKLWNATRFILMNVEAGHGAPSVEELGERLEEEESPLAVRWVMSRLADTRAEVEAALGEYRFNDAASALYQFAWHEFCDWYIEMAKTEMSAASRDCLLLVLENLLRMLQPFMPFLAEDIWQRLPLTRPTESIVTAPWPAALARDPEAEREMAMVMDAVGGVRSIRGEMNIPPAQVLETHVKTASGEVEALLRSNLHYVSKLARAEVKGLGTGVAKPGGAYTSVKDGLEVYVKLAGIDVDAELTRLGREKKKLEGTLGVLHKKLHNPDFLERAPAHVVRKEQQKYDELAQRQEKLAESIAKIKGLEV
jgi:valyl-tRNA synthetase